MNKTTIFKRLFALSLSSLLLIISQPAWSQTEYTRHPLESHAFPSPNYQPSESLSCSTKECLERQKDPGRAMALNLIPLGFGSYQQGDQIGGLTLSVMDGLSLTSIAIGIPLLSQSGNWGALMFIGYGLMGLGLGRAVGFIAPWLHHAQYQQSASGPKGADLSRENSWNQPPMISYSTAF